MLQKDNSHCFVADEELSCESDVSNMLVKTSAKCWAHVFSTQPTSHSPSPGSVYASARFSVEEIKVSIKGFELIWQAGVAHIDVGIFAFAIHDCQPCVYAVVFYVEVPFKTLLDAFTAFIVSNMATFHLSLVA